MRRSLVVLVALLLLGAPAGVALAATDVEVPSITVTGTVYLDLDGDGTQGAAEPGRAAVSVTLLGRAAVLDAAVTDSLGRFTFGDVPVGEHEIAVDVPSGLRATSPARSTVVVDGDVDVVDTGGIVGLGTTLERGPDLAVATVVELAEDGTLELLWRTTVHDVGWDPVAGPVTLRLVLDGGHEAMSASGDGWSCSTATQMVTCDHIDGITVGGSTAPVTLRSTATGDVGTTITTTATVRAENAFDAAPRNDEAAASTTIGLALAVLDTAAEGDTSAMDVAATLPMTGSSTALTSATAIAALMLGVATLRRTRRQ